MRLLLLGSTTRSLASPEGNPAKDRVQVLPPSVLRKMPPAKAPVLGDKSLLVEATKRTKLLLESTVGAMLAICRFRKVFPPRTFQLAPLSVVSSRPISGSLRPTPSPLLNCPVPANKMLWFGSRLVGAKARAPMESDGN